MRRLATIAVFALGLAAPALAIAQTVPARAVLDKYCVSCHNEKLKVAGLTLDSMNVEDVGAAADVWEKVARKFRTHEMPPPGRPRPDRDTYSAMASRIETALDNAAAAKPNPGRVAVHRLNRVEYANSIRDLLGLEIDSRSLLAGRRLESGELRQHRERSLGVAGAARRLPVGRHESQSPCCWRYLHGCQSSTRIKSPKRWCKTTGRATIFPSGRKAAP